MSILEELDALYRASTQGTWQHDKQDEVIEAYIVDGNYTIAEVSGADAAWIAAIHNAWPKVVELARAGEGVPWATDDERGDLRTRLAREIGRSDAAQLAIATNVQELSRADWIIGDLRTRLAAMTARAKKAENK